MRILLIISVIAVASAAVLFITLDTHDQPGTTLSSEGQSSQDQASLDQPQNLAQTSPQPHAQTRATDMTDEDYRVISAALRGRLDVSEGTYVLIPETVWPRSQLLSGSRLDDALPLFSELEDDEEELWETLNERNIATSHFDTERFTIGGTATVVLLSLEEWDSQFQDWEEFHDTYKGNRGLMEVSLPAYNTDHTVAILYIGFSLGGLAAGGDVLFLHRHEGEQNWWLENTVSIWMS